MAGKARKVKPTSSFAKRRKMVKCSGDSISKLPDEILVSVLSLLPIEEAASTSLLSKRWLHLWKHFNGSLDFIASKIIPEKILVKSATLKKEIPKYIRWVNQVIESHHGPTIREFKVNFLLNAKFAHEIDKWIEFAISKRVERLKLDFEFLFYCSKEFAFPESMFSYIKSPSGSFCIRSLRYLCFGRMNIAGEILEFFIYNCPLLEELLVKFSTSLINLRVVGCSLCLKRLEICFCHSIESIEIFAPRLVSFAYMGPTTRLLITYAPMLLDLSIDGRLFQPTTDAFGSLSCYLSQLETLTLLETYAKADMEFLQSLQLCNLKNLTLGVNASDDDSLLGWTSLIKASPSLQKFRVELSCSRSWERRSRTREIRKAARCRHQFLKVVEFVGFVGHAIDLELFAYLIDNSPALESIVIYCGEPFFWEYPMISQEDTEIKRAKRRAREFRRTIPPGLELSIY